ncbi:hypothetical protein [Campylobacter sp. MG1]|uniref:hypothetical protein n=1 Tax=Campylobacter sp. MG1 TaxID=2976332 RepID=UPI00226D06EE|nr:hypothetical protein [Campylobacter sp. MG1]
MDIKKAYSETLKLQSKLENCVPIMQKSFYDNSYSVKLIPIDNLILQNMISGNNFNKDKYAR